MRKQKHSQKLFVHIGLHKTGTSTIQLAIHKNKELLRKHGIFIPKSGAVGPLQIHYNIAWFLSNDPRYIDNNGIHLDLAKEIKESSGENFLISSEDLCLLDEEAVFKFSNALDQQIDTKIIIYLRDPESWIKSRWMQVVKAGYETRSLSEYISVFCRTHSSFYVDVITRWGNAFGRNNLIIRSYNDAVHSGGLLDDFWEALAIPEKERSQFIVPKNQNISISYKLIELIRQVNARIDPNLRQRSNNRALARFYHMIHEFDSYLRKEYESRYSIISAEDRVLINEVYGPGNALIAQEFFDRDQLFPLKSGELDERVNHDMSFHEDDLLNLISFIGERIIQENIKDKI